jgi:hypothetical protein
LNLVALDLAGDNDLGDHVGDSLRSLWVTQRMRQSASDSLFSSRGAQVFIGVNARQFIRADPLPESARLRRDYR